MVPPDEDLVGAGTARVLGEGRGVEAPEPDSRRGEELLADGVILAKRVSAAGDTGAVTVREQIRHGLQWDLPVSCQQHFAIDLDSSELVHHGV